MTGRSWWEADPARLLTERTELQARHPGFEVRLDETRLVCFEGRLIVIGVGTAGMCLPVSIRLPDTYPARAPKVLDAEGWIPESRRGSHQWHVNHDGTVCFADPSEWSPQFTVADLVDTVTDWMVNTIALEVGLIDEMPKTGRVGPGVMQLVTR